VTDSNLNIGHENINNNDSNVNKKKLVNIGMIKSMLDNVEVSFPFM